MISPYVEQHTLTKPSAISTYRGQGVLKRGCNAVEHTIVYLTGQQPVYIQGEWEKGMTKEPIMIQPTDMTERMDPMSRVRLGKAYPIEWNVKLRDIGMVSRGDMTKLVRYYREEAGNGFDPDPEEEDNDEEEGDGEDQRENANAAAQYTYANSSTYQYQ